MTKDILIFGKHTWPYTQKAREAKDQEGYTVTYRDVKEEPEYLEEMLKLTDGGRKGPVLVEEGRVTIGFGGT